MKTEEQSQPDTEEMSKYDDAEWHYGGNFPRWTPKRNGFAHIGFLLTWLVDNGLVSEFLKEESSNIVEATIDRSVSPIALLEYWDGKLVSDMLSKQGNAFVKSYYKDQENGYFLNYMSEFSELGNYKVKPNWKNYNRIQPVINQRFEEWRALQK